jgi:hypothetical protein
LRPFAALLLVVACVAFAPARGRQVPTVPAQSAPTTSALTGAVSGVVVDGTTNKPIAAAVVSLVSSGRGQTFSGRLVTDSKGRFVFGGLPASGSYELMASKPGYTAPGFERGIGATVSRFALAEGQWIAAPITMWRLGGISGTVLDEAGEPVVGIPVRVIAQIPRAGTFQPAAGPIATTDDRGFYRVGGLSRGRYIVTVPSVQSAVPASTSAETIGGVTLESLARARVAEPLANAAGIDLGTSRLIIGNYATPPPPGARPQAYPTLFFPNARSMTSATPIDLKDGEDRQGVDFALQPVSTADVAGKVIGPAAALANLVIRLMLTGSEDLGVGSEQATALLAADGSFRFLAVPAGSYTLIARRQVSELIIRGASIGGGLPATPGMLNATSCGTMGPAPAGSMVASRNCQMDDTYSARLRLDVGAKDLADLVVPLKRGATISGDVVYESSTPLQVQVFAEAASGSPTATVVNVSERGPAVAREFSIGALKSDEYFLRVSGFGGSLAVKSISASGGDYTDRPFDMASGTDVTGVVVTVTDKTARLSGVVRDRSGALVPQATVVIFPADQSLWRRFGVTPPRIKAAALSAKSSYELAGLPRGDYYVIAVDSAFGDAWQDPRFFPAAVAGAAERISLDWGQARVQDLTIRPVSIK